MAIVAVAVESRGGARPAAKTRTVTVLFALLTAALCCSCQSAVSSESTLPGAPDSAAEVEVNKPPPSPRLEERGEAPAPHYAWVSGSWHWDEGRWKWIGGHWVPRYDQQTYVRPTYVARDGRYLYRPGYWQRQPTTTRAARR